MSWKDRPHTVPAKHQTIFNRCKLEITAMQHYEHEQATKIVYSKGLTYWWYNPEIDVFMAMKSQAVPKPLWDSKQWILICKAKDGEVLC